MKTRLRGHMGITGELQPYHPGHGVYIREVFTIPYYFKY